MVRSLPEVRRDSTAICFISKKAVTATIREFQRSEQQQQQASVYKFGRIPDAILTVPIYDNKVHSLVWSMHNVKDSS